MKNSLETLKFSFCHGLETSFGRQCSKKERNHTEVKTTQDIKSPIYSYSVENDLGFLINSSKVRGLKLLESKSQVRLSSRAEFV